MKWYAWILVAIVCVAPTAPAAHADRSYTVRSGDTLARIARRFRVPISDLRRANRLRGDNVRIGARLTIPGRGSAAQARREGFHVVRRGETISHIARRYRVTAQSLRRTNRLRGDSIRIGQRLRIPGRRRENRMPRLETRALRPDQTAAEERATRLDLGATRVGQNLVSQPPDPRWIAAAARAPRSIPAHAYGVGTPIDADAEEEDDEEEEVSEDEHVPDETEDEEDPDPATDATDAPEPTAGPGTLGMPIDGGTFMRGWGSGRGGYHLAVDIYAPPGTPIVASERGLVAYAGTGMGGYGRFVILVHPNGLVTAYAHNRELLVVTGELVARGQVISLLGNTGLSRGPHLHYMLVHDGAHCDPLPLLRPRIRFRNGRPVTTDIATWTDTKPDEVQCLPRSARPYPGNRRRRRR